MRFASFALFVGSEGAIQLQVVNRPYPAPSRFQDGPANIPLTINHSNESDSFDESSNLMPVNQLAQRVVDTQGDPEDLMTRLQQEDGAINIDQLPDALKDFADDFKNIQFADLQQAVDNLLVSIRFILPHLPK